MTPSQNVLLASVHSHEFSVVDTSTGQTIQKGTDTHPFHYRRFNRPQSVTNPVRPDKTRAPSNWSADWFTCSELPGSWSQRKELPWVYSSRGQLLHDSVVDRVYPSDSLDGQMRNTRLKALATSVDSSTQLNAALAQSRGIVTMSNEYLQRLNRFFELVPPHMVNDYDQTPIRFAQVVKKYGRPSKWRKVPGDYLAYLYGIAPLGDDIANGLDRLTSYRLKGLGMSMLCRGSETRKEQFREPANFYIGLGVYSGSLLVDRTQVTKATYRFDIPSWYLDSAPTRTPFSTLYELAPYSFVLDWFLPVGHWIQALESAQFSPFFTEGSETSFIRDSCDLASASTPFGSVRLGGKMTRGRMRRVALFDYPSSVLTRPSLKPFPGIQQVSQGLSLLAQAMQRWR